MKSIRLKFTAFEIMGLGISVGEPAMPAGGRAGLVDRINTYSRLNETA